ncbi:hypothetical protein [Thalassolituus sp.]|jgi:hypothetical protein|uniref:hypothetical protein n=1 Tax=Thalassolituus sp. TaxID=2030822 RepID=UPI0035162DFF
MMAAVDLDQEYSLSTGHLVPVALTGQSGKQVFLTNLPAQSGRSGLVGYTPQLQELIAEAMPFAWHVLDRQKAAADQPLHLFYINPKEPLESNVDRLVDFLRSLAGTHRTWLPLSSSHTMMMHTLLLSLPQLVGIELSSLTLLHIGDNALHPGLELLARNHGMGYCFHALY